MIGAEIRDWGRIFFKISCVTISEQSNIKGSQEDWLPFFAYLKNKQQRVRIEKIKFWQVMYLNFYISDLHFGHSNVIQFDNRPFSDRDEMDQVMISLWNARVTDQDHVYIVGDFCYRNNYTADWYLKRLKGHKHLIIGNHDGDTLKNEKAMSYIESVEKMMHISDNGNQICLCHFPIAEWNGYHRGHWHVYGHIHGRLDDTYYFMRNREKALNAAACINHYMPVPLSELIINNQKFKELHK